MAQEPYTLLIDIDPEKTEPGTIVDVLNALTGVAVRELLQGHGEED